jgi:hypothetical protein
MDIVLSKGRRLPFGIRLRIIWLAWKMGDFQNTWTVLVHGRTGTFKS